MRSHLSRIRVRYAETDQMGVVYHANYLVWMEVARVEFCAAAGFRYRDMEHDGVLIAVAEAHCRYLSPARFDDEIEVRTTVSEANRRFVTFDYEMLCAGRRTASGQTRHIFLDREFRPARLPEKYLEMFGDAPTIRDQNRE
ncbi:MAG TPA: thioesterase family protein [Bryobacteraceae bacterium]|nr:thioesterase family protein [Bryobacteraceae bacterium]